MGYARTGMRGLGDCGTNPCGFFDVVPFPGLFTSAACNAYLACQLTGEKLTPTPAEIGASNPFGAGGILDIGGGGGSSAPFTGGSGGGAMTVQQLQQACKQTGGTWDAVAGACTPQGSIPTTWLIGGGIAVGLVLLLMVVKR